MQTRITIDREGARTASAIRTAAASGCILGLAGLVWLHSEPAVTVASNTVPATPAAAAPAYLHAPTSDPSLPGLDALRSPEQVTDAIPAPVAAF